VSLRKQGANKGAVTSFLISTPESGVDSIAITYALLDPILTVMRPVAAFFTAFAAGIAENLRKKEMPIREIKPDLSCPVDGCCDGKDCDPKVHRRHHGFFEKLGSGLRYAFTDFWDDLAGYFFMGLLLAGLITVLVPDSFFTEYLGAGLPAMLIMLVAGVPLYVCATASTPIAAALTLKGVSPGAALVFLLVGPATNMATLTVLLGILGKRSTAVYLASIAVCAVLFGLLIDQIYALTGLSVTAAVGQAGETIPHWLAWVGAVALVLISIRPIAISVKKLFRSKSAKSIPTPESESPETESLKSDTTNYDLPVDSCGPT
jgi:uncharacterized membrane protein YraQ (UPF0718 family)